MSERPLFKQCPSCQQFSPEESRACLQCGFSFDSEQAPIESGKVEGLKGLSRQPPETPEEQAPTKKSGCSRNLGLGVLIIVGLLTVLVVIGSLLPNDFDESTTSVQSTSTPMQYASTPMQYASTPVPTYTTTPAGSTVTETTGQSDTQTQAQPTESSAPSTPLSTTETPVPTPMLTIDSEMNVRNGPGTNYPVIGMASPGQEYPITAKNPAGDWWKINYSGQVGWVFGQLVTPNNATHVQIAASIPTPLPTPRPTSTPRPRPTQTPRVTLDRTQRANLWVYISNDGNYMVVYADPAFDIEEFDLDLFVDGREYCNTSKIYNDEGPRKLSCEAEQRRHTSVQRVSAHTPRGDLKCERHVESDSHTSVFACVFR